MNAFLKRVANTLVPGSRAYPSIIGRLFPVVLVVLTLAGCAHTQPHHTQRPGVAEELVALEKEWNRALLARDLPVLEILYAKDMVMVEPGGRVVGRDHDLNDVRTGKLSFQKIEMHETDVWDYGAFVVVHVRNTSEGRYDGKVFSDNLRFTDIFVRRDSRWQCVSSSATRVQP